MALQNRSNIPATQVSASVLSSKPSGHAQTNAESPSSGKHRSLHPPLLVKQGDVRDPSRKKK